MIILIIEDHPTIIDILEVKLNNDFKDLVIYKTFTLEEAFHILETRKVDRVICDLQIQIGKNMIIPEFCSTQSIPFMVFSSYVNITLIKILSNFRVTCYISKGSQTIYLHKGLQMLISNQRYFCPLVEQELKNKNESFIPQPILTVSESKVVKAFSEGMSTEDVAKFLNLKTVTVRNHRARLLDRNLCSFQELLRRYKFWEE